MRVEACQSDYHHNFSVHGGERTYYDGIPEMVQAGEHQFIEVTVARMWINNLLLAWFV